MLNSNFSPYDLLTNLAEQCVRNHKNTIELASAHNKQAVALEELARQHQDLIDLFSKTRKELVSLRTQLEMHKIKNK